MRHNEKEIQLGVALFNKVCHDCTVALNKDGQKVWSGSTCESGGSYIRHKLNEDLMTPAFVASSLGIKSIIRPAKAAYKDEIKKQTEKYLSL